MKGWKPLSIAHVGSNIYQVAISPEQTQIHCCNVNKLDANILLAIKLLFSTEMLMCRSLASFRYI